MFVFLCGYILLVFVHLLSCLVETLIGSKPTNHDTHSMPCRNFIHSFYLRKYLFGPIKIRDIGGVKAKPKSKSTNETKCYQFFGGAGILNMKLVGNK